MPLVPSSQRSVGSNFPPMKALHVEKHHRSGVEAVQRACVTVMVAWSAGSESSDAKLTSIRGASVSWNSLHLMPAGPLTSQHQWCGIQVSC